MHSFVRRGFPVLILLTAVFVIGCEAQGSPVPRPTWTPRPSATPEPTDTPTPFPTDTPIPSPTARVAAQLVPNPSTVTDVNPAARAPGARDPLIPVFGPFPPIAIPARPANLNPLTGTAANPASLQRRPILVRIGNDKRARDNLWQAGFNSADIVFEELIDALGNIYANTRFTAVFLSNDPPLIGPIRSGRIVNLQLAPMMDGALSNAGASNGTRWIFSQTPMINIDEFFNMPAYCYDKTRGYEGRLLTTGPRLREWMAQKGWEKPVPLFGFNFSNSAPSGQAITSVGISKAPWTTPFEWKYDANSGTYLRYSTGAPHIDNSYPVSAKWGSGADCITTGTPTQSQVRTQNIVALFAKYEKTNIIEDSNNAVSVNITLTGAGDAVFFRDGQMIRGKWQRKSEQEFFNLTDTAGNAYGLKPGITWFELVPIGLPLDLK